MTSNLGSHHIAERAGRGTTALDEGTRRHVMDALRAHFPPEFLNRIDEIVFFHALDREHLKRIVEIQLLSLVKRLADRRIDLDVTDRAKEVLVDEGYDPVYGARPLKRTIQRRVLDPLALAVLQGTFVEGDRVVVDSGPEGLSFAKAVGPVVH
jgi:ATP-dependent Clp protease ATP-binding subunit ClpB